MVSPGDSPACTRLYGNNRRPCGGLGNHGNVVLESGPLCVSVGAPAGSAGAPRGRFPHHQQHGSGHGRIFLFNRHR